MKYSRARYVFKYSTVLLKRLHVIVPLILFLIFMMPEFWAVFFATSLFWYITH